MQRSNTQIGSRSEPADSPNGGRNSDGTQRKKCNCDCQGVQRPPLGQTTPPKRKGDCGGRRSDCCEQLIEILRRVPNLRLPELHKPKQRPRAKAHCLCGSLPVADAIIPAMIAIFRRYTGSEPPRNSYEKVLYQALDQLDENKKEALDVGFKSYRDWSPRLRDCLFDNSLARKADRE